MKILSLRPCDDCGQPDERDIRKKRCGPCQRKSRVASTLRYRATPEGHAKYLASRQEPKWKLYAAAWRDAHPEKTREYAFRHNAKRRKSGRVIPCATLECPGTFVRTPFNGHQLFGNDCGCAKLHRQYRQVIANKRPRKRAA